MTIVRALNSSGDWLFGKSLNDYLSANDAIKQNIQTRLLSFLGDCFFDITAGIDWITLLGGSKNQLALNLNISSVILNTQSVTGIKQLSVNLDDSNRKFSVSYQVATIYSLTNASFEYTLGI